MTVTLRKQRMLERHACEKRLLALRENVAEAIARVLAPFVETCERENDGFTVRILGKPGCQDIEVCVDCYGVTNRNSHETPEAALMYGDEPDEPVEPIVAVGGPGPIADDTPF